MTYIDLGRYRFTTTPDRSGFNPGNMTSVLDTGPIIQISYFECYRIVLNTSQLQTTVPQLVQSASRHIDTSLTTLVVTLPKATTPGNTIVVATQSLATGATPSPVSATLGASADHFGLISATTSNGNQGMAFLVNPNSTAAATTVTITYSGGTGTGILEAFVYEFSGTLSTTTAAASVEWGAAGNSQFANANTLTALPNSATTHINDVFIGLVGALTTGTATPTLGTSTIVPSLTQMTQVNDVPGVNITAALQSQWGLTGTLGTPLGYTGTTDIAGTMAVAAVALLPVAVQPAPVAIPFTVATDGHTWDVNATVPGVGFTYDLQMPMALNNGNNLQILWSLASNLYASSAGLFDVTAWFRYDPAKN